MSTVFTPNSSSISAFTCKKFKSHVDSNDHLHCSFDLYFKGKKAASYTLDPWSQESKITFISDSMKDAMIAHAQEQKLFDELKAMYRQDILPLLPENEREDRLNQQAFDIIDVIDTLSNVFMQIHEDKKHQDKLKRLFKKGFVIGNDEGYLKIMYKVELTEVLKHPKGRSALEQSFKQAQEIAKKHASEGYSILNPKSQLESLGLV